MEEVLRSIGGLMLQAAPTFLIVLILYLYLKRVYFGPMERVLAQRYEATEGARKLAAESLAKAEAKAVEFETALKAARGQLYREQEEFRLKLRQDQTAAVAEARQQAQATVQEAGRKLAAEVQTAKQALALQADALAGEIARTILHRRTA